MDMCAYASVFYLDYFFPGEPAVEGMLLLSKHPCSETKGAGN